MVITTTQQLSEVCKRFAQNEFVAVDTEFIREKKFFPELCLIQIASPNEAYCIDPLENIQLEPLFELFQNKNVIKVFHAARQDIEIIFHLSGKMPTPVFDTQIAAMACGFGENISYQQLVKELLKINLDKSMRCTNWYKRPLNEKQIQYALCDVTYLCTVYKHIQEILKTNHRSDWIQEELKELTNPDIYDPTPEQLAGKARNSHLTGEALFLYQKLYILREQFARKKNRPRRHIIKDELLHEFAVIRPQDEKQMKTIRILPGGFEKSDIAKAIFQLCRETSDTPVILKPAEPIRNLTNTQKNLIEILRLALHLISLQENVAAPLITSNADLENFVCDQDVAFMHGWRYQVFGEKALKIKKGETGLFYHPKLKKIQFVSTTPAEN